jgi:parallel beta-helix repeat protein
MERFVSMVVKAARVARVVLLASALCVAAASTGHAACKTITNLAPTACGVVISTPGCYIIRNNLAATSDSGDCIEITAPDVYLNLADGEAITGTGAGSTGNGIHVTSTAAGATIVNGFVSSFNIGILAEARVRLEGPLVEFSNADGIQLSNAAASKIVGAIAIYNGYNAGIEIDGSNDCSLLNVAAAANPLGVLVSGSSGTDISNANINGNDTWGILVTQANSAPFALSNGANISGSYVYSNGVVGIWVLGGNGNKISANQIYENGRYGVWLDAAAGNEIGENTLYGNGIADVYLGCSETGPTGSIGCTNRASANEIDLNSSNGNGDYPYGIVIDDSTNKSNMVLDNTSTMHTTDDMYDSNPKTANTWFANTFTTANQSFIN